MLIFKQWYQMIIPGVRYLRISELFINPKGRKLFLTIQDNFFQLILKISEKHMQNSYKTDCILLGEFLYFKLIVCQARKKYSLLSHVVLLNNHWEKKTVDLIFTMKCNFDNCFGYGTTKAFERMERFVFPSSNAW